MLLSVPSSSFAHPGWGLAVDSEGSVYFTDIEGLTIWKRLPNGTLQAAVTDVWTHHLFIDDQDNLYPRLRKHSPDGSFTTLLTLGEVGTDKEDESPKDAEAVGLHNAPNPFRGRTTISYDLPAPAQVSLSIYDSTGRQLKRLVQTSQKAGHYHVD